MGKALLQLPKQRYDTLLYILEFMFCVDKFKSYNKMDIGNLSIMLAPKLIECLETTNVQTTLIAPLHITNTIIHYYKRLRIKVIFFLLLSINKLKKKKKIKKNLMIYNL